MTVMVAILICTVLKPSLTFDHMVGWYACSICECPLISDIAATGRWKRGREWERRFTASVKEIHDELDMNIYFRSVTHK